MAFTDSRPDSNRAAKILAVSAFHAAAIYVIVTGLGVEFVKRERWAIPAGEFPIEPAPPPPVEPKPVKKPDIVEFVPPVALPVPDIAPPSDLRIDPGPLPVDQPQLLPMPPQPVPKPAFTPKQATPRNDPGQWVTTNDYPTHDIRQGNEGTVRFRLSIDPSGKVRDCAIVASSGFAGLDAATCRNLTRRARFEPATDSAGKQDAGTYSGTVRWVIPQD